MKYVNLFLLVLILFAGCVTGRPEVPDCPDPSERVYSEVERMIYLNQGNNISGGYPDTLVWISEMVRYCDAIREL